MLTIVLNVHLHQGLRNRGQKADRADCDHDRNNVTAPYFQPQSRKSAEPGGTADLLLLLTTVQSRFKGNSASPSPAPLLNPSNHNRSKRG